jgi:hypothetical protein
LLLFMEVIKDDSNSLSIYLLLLQVPKAFT